jgi:TatD DNase family protein
MIDTHAHLHVKAFDPDRAQALARAFAAGLSAILEVCIDAGGWPHALRLARSDPRVFLTAGIHPHDAGRATEEDLDVLFRQLGEPRLRAVGETGLDYYRNYAPHDLQRRFFARHVAAAVEADLPLVVHVRGAQGNPAAHDDAVRILREEGRGRARGVFHCFSGDLAQARSAISLGFLLGLGGSITYDPPRSAPLFRTIAREFGTGVFVLETDCPYLTPHPRRRERNEPANIPAIAQALAAHLGMPPREVERITDANAQALFRLEG